MITILIAMCFSCGEEICTHLWIYLRKNGTIWVLSQNTLNNDITDTVSTRVSWVSIIAGLSIKLKKKTCISCAQLRNSMGEIVGNVDVTDWGMLLAFFEIWTSRLNIKSYNDHVSLRYHLAFQIFSLLNSKIRAWIRWRLEIGSPWVSSVSSHLVSKGTNGLCPRLSLQSWLYSEHPRASQVALVVKNKCINKPAW